MEWLEILFSVCVPWIRQLHRMDGILLVDDGAWGMRDLSLVLRCLRLERVLHILELMQLAIQFRLPEADAISYTIKIA